MSNNLSSHPVMKLNLSPEEIQPFKIDTEIAKQKIQEAKGAMFAKNMSNPIDICDKENQPDTAKLPLINNDMNPFKWPHGAILLLIDEYKSRESDFTSGRISQKKLWEKISKVLIKDGHAATGPQCMSKLSGLKKTDKFIKDHNVKSGNGTRAWMYFDVMDDLMRKKTSIAPATTISSTGKRRSSETESENESHSGNRSPKRRALSQTGNEEIISALQKSKDIAEENRERRHKEKMEQRDRSIALLEKILATCQKRNTLLKHSDIVQFYHFIYTAFINLNKFIT